MPRSASKPSLACALTEAAPVSPFAADLEPVCAGLDARVWDGLRGRSIFITGGTGFVGSWLVDGLLHANRTRGLGLSITALGRTPAAFLSALPHLRADAALRLHQGDVTSFDFPARPFDMAVHAALPVAAPGAAGDLLATASAGAARMVQFAQARSVRRLLHVSSGAVYGPQPDAVSHLDEDSPWDADLPVNEYTRAKRAEERILRSTSPTRVTARCFALLGPRLPATAGMAAAQFIVQAAQGHPVLVQGDGQAVRSYQYAADLAGWLLTLLVLGPHEGVYNVGSEEAISIGELARRTAAIAGTGSSVQVLGEPLAGRAGSRYLPSTARARRAFGLSNRVGIDEALARTLRWRCASGTSISA